MDRREKTFKGTKRKVRIQSDRTWEEAAKAEAEQQHAEAERREEESRWHLPKFGWKADRERDSGTDLADSLDAVSGKIALVLSGGGSRGAYQVGVWRALREMGVPIHIACGTSIGSLNAAAVAQDTYERAEALWMQLETDMIFDYANVVENRGVKFTTIKDVLAQNLIEKDIRASDIDFGIVTVKFPSLEPLYLWIEDIPEGEMLDYILASSSCFPAVAPYEIHDEKFLDGAFHDVMPVGLALEKGADHIIAVNLDTTGLLRKEDMEMAEDRLTIVQCHWELGSFLIFDTDNAKHIMRLGYLDALKTFGILEGYRYAFGKSQLDADSLRLADYAAFAFELDPEIIYSKSVLFRQLRQHIEDYKQSEESDLEDLRAGLKKLSLLQAERVIELVRSLSRRALIVYFADYLFAQEAAAEDAEEKGKDLPAPIRKALEKLFEKDIAAAAWLIENELIEPTPES